MEIPGVRGKPVCVRESRGYPGVRGNPEGAWETRVREGIPRVPRSASISRRLPSRYLAAQCENLARDALAPSRRAPAARRMCFARGARAQSPRAPAARRAGFAREARAQTRALPRLNARISRGKPARSPRALPRLDARVSRGAHARCAGTLPRARRACFTRARIRRARVNLRGAPPSWVGTTEQPSRSAVLPQALWWGIKRGPFQNSYLQVRLMHTHVDGQSKFGPYTRYSWAEVYASISWVPALLWIHSLSLSRVSQL